jgi:hypothetical protein
MTQNDKEILLQDISGRIPYRPLMFIQSSSSDKYKSRFNVRLDASVYDDILNGECEAIPYLFPMSHLTDEQCREIEFLAFSKRYGEIIDIYNRNHIDYRGMLEMELAIDASDLIVYVY